MWAYWFSSQSFVVLAPPSTIVVVWGVTVTKSAKALAFSRLHVAVTDARSSSPKSTSSKQNTQPVAPSLKALDAEDIPYALKHFDQLPDAGFIRKPILKLLLGCSDSTIQRRVLDGLLPRPKKLSPRISAWNIGLLRASLAAKSESGNV
jgi:predicted DNA-binding transcriptional regulator AlpA